MKNIHKKRKIVKEFLEDREKKINPDTSMIFKKDIESNLNKINISYFLEKNNSFLNNTDFSTYNKPFQNKLKNYNEISLISLYSEYSITGINSIINILSENKKISVTNFRNKQFKSLHSNLEQDSNLKQNLRDDNKRKFQSFNTKINNHNYIKKKGFSCLNTPKFQQKTCLMNYASSKLQTGKLTLKYKIKEFKEVFSRKESKGINSNELKINLQARFKKSSDNMENVVSSCKERVLLSLSNKRIKTDSNDKKDLASIPKKEKNKLIKNEKLLKNDLNKSDKTHKTIKNEKKSNLNLPSQKSKNYSSSNLNFNLIKSKESFENNIISSEKKVKKEKLFVISEITEKKTSCLLNNDKQTNIDTKRLKVQKRISKLNIDFIDSNVPKTVIKKTNQENSFKRKTMTINLDQSSRNLNKEYLSSRKSSKQLININGTSDFNIFGNFLKIKNLNFSQKIIDRIGTSINLTPKTTSQQNSTACSSAKQAINSFKLSDKIKSLKSIEIQQPINEKMPLTSKQVKNTKNLKITSFYENIILDNNNKPNKEKEIKSLKNNQRYIEIKNKKLGV